jgi:hypothetical protein
LMSPQARRYWKSQSPQPDSSSSIASGQPASAS